MYSYARCAVIRIKTTSLGSKLALLELMRPAAKQSLNCELRGGELSQAGASGDSSSCHSHTPTSC